MEFHPIGTIHTPHTELTGMPIQPAGASGIAGWIELQPDLAPGLQDLDGFSHLILLYHFHATEGFRLQVTPFLDDQPHGVFATRAPRRPNPIGLSVVRLLNIEGPILRIADVDMLDGTPLLDIKPYVPAFDHHPADRLGWLTTAGQRADCHRSDDRFL